MMKRLLVISHTPHFARGDAIVGWGPTVKELDYLADHFDEVRHVAPLHPGPGTASDLPYQNPRISVLKVQPAGGNHLRDKIRVIFSYPRYLLRILQQLSWSDVVFVRCPANISLLALIVLICLRRPVFRWFKYAGSWQPARGEDRFSYWLQRQILNRNLARGPVMVNGKWMKQPDHVHHFINPCLTKTEIDFAEKIPEKSLALPLNLLFVGRTEEVKGLRQALEICADLKNNQIEFKLDVIGDGPERPYFEKMAHELNLADYVSWKGWLNREAIRPFYAAGHFLLLPSHTEGWPKVIGEAMAYGVVPVASKAGSIPQVLSEARCGASIPYQETKAYYQALVDYIHNPQKWQSESRNGRHFSKQFTYEGYITALGGMFKKSWGVSLDDA